MRTQPISVLKSFLLYHWVIWGPGIKSNAQENNQKFFVFLAVHRKANEINMELKLTLLALK